MWRPGTTSRPRHWAMGRLVPQRSRTALLQSVGVGNADLVASALGFLGVPRAAGLIGIVLIAAASAGLAGLPAAAKQSPEPSAG